jgi:YVTN family beta-propeller protein
VVATIAGFLDPLGIAITPDGTRAYVTNEGSASVSVIDTTTNTVVATIPVFPGQVPIGVAIAPDGTRAYVANNFGGVSVIDTATNTVVATVPFVGGLAVAITPDGTRAYVTGGGATVSVINTANNTVSANINVVGLARFITAIAITPDGTRAYVTDEATNDALVIDTATNAVVAEFPVGGPPVAIAITPAPQAPKSKEECKQGGYLKFGPPAGPFKNQGQCVSYVEHHQGS